MNFQTHHQTSINISGTSLSDYIKATFDELVQAFGEPFEGNYKTDWEWEIEFDDGTVATIYNWKDGPNYCGSHGKKSFEITEWHIGSRTMDAATRVHDIINEQRTTNAMNALSESMNPAGGE